MKKLLLGIILYTGLLQAQQAIDTTKFDYMGRAIDSTLYAGDASYLNDLFDKDHMIKKVTKESDEAYVKEFNIGFEQGVRNSFNLGQQIIVEVGENGTYDFVKSRVNSKGEYHLLFRLYGDNEGLNYHDFKLEKVGAEYKIVDVFFFTSGEYLTETFSNLYNATLSSRPGLLSRFFKKTVLDDLLTIKEIKPLMASGDYKQAYEKYKKLSSEGKKQKAIQLIGVQIASNIDDETYGRYIKKYEESFSNDPSLYLISIDGYILSEEYNKSLQTIDKLDKALGGDSFLNLLRANVNYYMNNVGKAIEHLEVFMYDYPFFFDGFDSALSLYIEDGKFENAINILTIMIDRFEVDKAELKTVVEENFADFAKSPEYIKWSK